MVAVADLTGAQVGRVTVVARAGSSGGKATWLCLCVCGGQFNAVGTSLRKGGVRECPVCATRSRIERATKHGGVGSREYVSYSAMKSRCSNPNDKRFERYGGRGIKVCDHWVESFGNFLADMGPMPSAAHSIERLDNNADYKPGNCIWASIEVQANNRSNNTRIEICGETKNITQWARDTGVHRTVILRRMKRGLSGTALIQKG